MLSHRPSKLAEKTYNLNVVISGFATGGGVVYFGADICTFACACACVRASVFACFCFFVRGLNVCKHARSADALHARICVAVRKWALAKNIKNIKNVARNASSRLRTFRKLAKKIEPFLNSLIVPCTTQGK